MAGARGSVIVAIGVLFGVLIHCYITDAAQPVTYTVGDDLGWTGDASMETWPNGKTFYAGDILGGKGSVIVAIGLLFGMLIHCYITHAAPPATYIVGDDLGWNGLVSMETWPDGKTLYAGDILVFNYDPYQYNMVTTDQKGHDKCIITDAGKEYKSGHDQIQIALGANYFIDTISNLCPQGMKMAINATARPPA